MKQFLWLKVFESIWSGQCVALAWMRLPSCRSSRFQIGCASEPSTCAPWTGRVKVTAWFTWTAICHFWYDCLFDSFDFETTLILLSCNYNSWLMACKILDNTYYVLAENDSTEPKRKRANKCVRCHGRLPRSFHCHFAAGGAATWKPVAETHGTRPVSFTRMNHFNRALLTFTGFHSVEHDIWVGVLWEVDPQFD